MKKYRFFCAALLLVFLLPIFLIPVSAVEDPDIKAKNVILVDAAHDEVLYQKNADDKAYPASITKIMTALLVMEKLKDGTLTTDTMVTATKNCQKGLVEGGSTQDIKPGETMSVKDLLYCLLVPSANEAANILAEEVAGSIPDFVDLMNKKAKKLGCTSTHFVNPHGLHDDDHYSSAHDIYRIASAAMKYDLFREIVYTSVYETAATNMSASRTFYNTNALITQWKFRGYLYDKAIGIKTGSTDEAGYCLVSAAKDGDNYLIAVVLGTKIAATEGGVIMDRPQFSESKRLLQWGFDNFQRTTLTQADVPVASVKVTLSREREDVMVRPVGSIERTLPKDLDQSKINTEVKLFSDSVAAPVEEGQVLGELVLSYGEETYGKLDLVADTSVSRSTLLYIKSLIVGFFHNIFVQIILLVVVGGGFLFWLLVLRNRPRSYRGRFRLFRRRRSYRGGRRRRR